MRAFEATPEHTSRYPGEWYPGVCPNLEGTVKLVLAADCKSVPRKGQWGSIPWSSTLKRWLWVSALDSKSDGPGSSILPTSVVRLGR